MARWFVDRNPQRGIPSVSLRRLLPDAKFVGCEDLVVSGCSADSVRLDPGQVFVAVGEGAHGELTRALDRGAAAVVVERPCPEAGSPQVVVADARQALGRLCQALAGEPSDRLELVGVTGRSGATASSLFLRAIFEAVGDRFGAIGPETWSDGVSDYPAAADPRPQAIAEMLAAMVDRRCRGGVIAATEESWGSRRFEGVALDAALIADGGIPPGLDPESLGAVRRGRARPFRMIAPGGVAVVRAGDGEAELMGGVNLSARRVTFALGRRPGVNVWGEIDRLDGSGTRFRLFGFDREATVDLRPIGSRRVVQALGAATLAWSLGLEVGAVVDGLESVARIPGRLEPVADAGPFAVRVDRARTPDALRDALADFRELGPGPIHCVLGVTASIDPEIARAAEMAADRVILTVSDPALADPDALLDAFLARMLRPGRVLIEPDRASAIASAFSLALPGDSVLLACGPPFLDRRGDRTVARDDRSIALEWRKEHEKARKSA